MHGLDDQDWNDLGKLVWQRAGASLHLSRYCLWEELPIDEQHLWIGVARAVFREGLMRAIKLLTGEESRH